jgi:hypothetical protein
MTVGMQQCSPATDGVLCRSGARDLCAFIVGFIESLPLRRFVLASGKYTKEFHRYAWRDPDPLRQRIYCRLLRRNPALKSTGRSARGLESTAAGKHRVAMNVREEQLAQKIIDGKLAAQSRRRHGEQLTQ